MKVIRRQAIQVHPVPEKVMDPQGPFPRELFREERIVTEYESQYDEDGSDTPLGATVQNNYKPERVLRCSHCFAKVLESQTKDHTCEEGSDAEEDR